MLTWNVHRGDFTFLEESFLWSNESLLQSESVFLCLLNTGQPKAKFPLKPEHLPFQDAPEYTSASISTIDPLLTCRSQPLPCLQAPGPESLLQRDPISSQCLPIPWTWKSFPSCTAFLSPADCKKTIWGLGSWAGTKKESLLSRRIRHAKIVLPVHETLPLLPALVLWKPVEAIVLAAPVSQRIFPRTTGIEKQKTLVSCV